MGLFDIIAAPLLKIVDKVIPDPAQKAAAQLAVLKLQSDNEFREIENKIKLDLAQLDVNKTEAANPSLFVSGWRPATGWVCNLGLIYQFLLHPVLAWLAQVKGFPVPPPLDTGTLLSLLGGMLGLSGLRTTEKIQGVAAK